MYTLDDLEWYITNFSNVAVEKRLKDKKRLDQVYYDYADKMERYYFEKVNGKKTTQTTLDD